MEIKTSIDKYLGTEDDINLSLQSLDCTIFFDHDIGKVIVEIGDNKFLDITQIESLVAHYKHVKKFSEE